jgi:5-(carboxyamino)imidazole ribonucleotide mutase
MKNGVLIVMGSVNDLPKIEPAIEVLKSFDIPFRATVASAHRTPDRAATIARLARADGYGVIIAAAGGAHHLGGAMAANTTLPVIALPISVGGLGGLDALLSAVQMPGGVPIASVGIDGAKNAGLIAASILSASDEQLARRLDEAREKQRIAVEESDRGLQLQLSAEE